MKRIFRLRLLVWPSDNRKSKTCPFDKLRAGSEHCRRIQNRKWLRLSVIAFALVVAGAVVHAQQPANISRIGFLSTTSPSNVPTRLEAFRQGLRDLGYVEGKNIVIEYRYAEGNIDRLPALLDELMRLKVDVIVASGPSPTRAAKKATATIPIVMTWDYDPVGNGYVASLARPGGNITGLSILAPEISGKQLELLKEIVPGLSRVAVIGESTNPGHAQQIKETELAAAALRVKLQTLNVRDPRDFETAFRAGREGRAEAVLVLGGPVLNSQRTRVVELAVKSRFPAIYNEQGFVEAGGLMTYGASFNNLYRRAATY